MKLIPTHRCTICRIYVRVLPPSGKRDMRVYEAETGKKHHHNNPQVLIPLPPNPQTPDLDLDDWGKYG